MRTLRRFLIRLTASATRRRDEERLREELEQHVALQTADNVRAGLSPVEARRPAVLTFGAMEAIKERYRDEQGLPVLDNLLQDVRYTLRQLQKAPLFTLTATLSLAMFECPDSGLLGAPTTEMQALAPTRRSASTRLSQFAMRFQLANVWLTTLS